MAVPFRLKRTRTMVFSPFTRLRDRLVLSDQLLGRKPRWPVQGPPQEMAPRPFFIIGYPRSGTTLLRAILSLRHDIFIPPENGSLGRMIRAFGSHRTQAWQVTVKAVLRAFCKGYEFHHWDIDLAAVQRSAESLPQEERTLAELFNLIYLHYGSLHTPGKTRWGDKSAPGYAHHLQKIDYVFPHAQYIHIVRDGRDCIASAVKAGFFGKSFIRAAYAWKDTIRECRRFSRKIHPQTRFFELRYEDLASSPQKEISAVCRFLAIEPTPEMLHYTGIHSITDMKTIPHHQNVIKPIFRDSIGSWQRQLPSSELHSIMRIIGKELAFFGYQ